VKNYSRDIYKVLITLGVAKRMGRYYVIYKPWLRKLEVLIDENSCTFIGKYGYGYEEAIGEVFLPDGQVIKVKEEINDYKKENHGFKIRFKLWKLKGYLAFSLLLHTLNLTIHYDKREFYPIISDPYSIHYDAYKRETKYPVKNSFTWVNAKPKVYGIEVVKNV
jgi:hypothetical protein